VLTPATIPADPLLAPDLGSDVVVVVVTVTAVSVAVVSVAVVVLVLVVTVVAVAVVTVVAVVVEEVVVPDSPHLGSTSHSLVVKHSCSGGTQSHVRSLGLRSMYLTATKLAPQVSHLHGGPTGVSVRCASPLDAHDPGSGMEM
jgi:hypothetical protein